MIDKWLTLGITTDEAHALRLIEDACRDAGDYGFFSRVTKLLQHWPDAINIEYAGACDMCHRDGLLTFRLPHRETDIDEDVLLFCGYFCPHCNFSNAGRRNE